MRTSGSHVYQYSNRAFDAATPFLGLRYSRLSEEILTKRPLTDIFEIDAVVVDTAYGPQIVPLAPLDRDVRRGESVVFASGPVHGEAKAYDPSASGRIRTVRRDFPVRALDCFGCYNHRSVTPATAVHEWTRQSESSRFIRRYRMYFPASSPVSSAEIPAVDSDVSDSVGRGA